MEEENEKIRGRDWRAGHFSGGEILRGGVMSRSLTVDFILLSLFTLFYFSFLFSFLFLFLEQLGLGFISHAVTSVTKQWRNYKTDHETWEKGVEGSGIK